MDGSGLSNASAKENVGDRRFPSIFMYNGLRKLFFPPEKLISKFVSEGQVVADLGCGPGYFTLPIAKLVGQKQGGKVYAVDFDAKALERLKVKSAEHGFEKTIETHISSASNVSFIPDSSVDFVIANGLLCCMSDHLGAISEINRILKKGHEGSAYLSITKFMRRSDPRAVLKHEWMNLVSEKFNLLKQGESFATRWALVSAILTGKYDKENVGEQKIPPSCCCSLP
ncbi:MAG: class I SAM-dependent methyltransferase [Nitrososphaerales archaeon]